jgi:regulator of replication initiation timing
MDAAKRSRQIPRMRTLQLEDDELRDAAQAARLACQQAEKDAEKQTNPRVRAMYDNAARRYRELAQRFERARMQCA